MIIGARLDGACDAEGFEVDVFDAPPTITELAEDIRPTMADNTGLDGTDLDALCIAWAESYHHRATELAAGYAQKMALAEQYGF